MHLSLARWQALQHDFGERLLTTTGGLDIGPASGRVVSGAREACQRHRLRHEVLEARDVVRRFPAWRLPQGFAAVHQPDAGFLRAERAILAHVSLARKLGADVREEEAVRGFSASGDRVAVTTQGGAYEAGSLVLAAGAWTTRLVPGFKELAIPERQVVAWFDASGPQFAAHAFPVFILECPQRGIFYGFPRLADEGVKIGKFHHRRERVDPDAIDRRIAAEDVMVLGEVESYLSAPLGPPLSCKTCMFVNSPDEHFIVDLLPGHRNVVVAAGFSGHGFKFCSGLGEILADLATSGATAHDTDLFRLSRPQLART
jgi:sarcosine oxidase